MEPDPMTAYERWRFRAAEQQQTFHTVLRLRQWDKLSREKENFGEYIRLKVSLAVYACSYSSCSDIQQSRIDSVVNLIRTSCDDFVKLSYTYISTWDGTRDGIVPVLRVICSEKEKSKEPRFIDVGNTDTLWYSSWKEFLSNNRPAHLCICYPENGFYDGSSEFVQVIYEKKRTESYDRKRKFLNHLDSCIFFPLRDTSLDRVRFVVKANEISITKTRLQSHSSEIPYTHLHSLAMWFKLILSVYGRELNAGSDITAMVIANNPAQKALDFFESFYESPYSVHGYFVVVHLMKMLAFRGMDTVHVEDTNKFADMLKFLLNICLTNEQTERLIVLLTEEYSLVNLFKFSPSCWEEVKGMIPEATDADVKKALELIAVQSRNIYSNFTQTEMIKIVTSLADYAKIHKGINADQFGRLYSDEVIAGYAGTFWYRYLDETLWNKHQTWLDIPGPINKIRGFFKYPLHMAKLIYTSFEKFSAAFHTDDFKLICEKGFVEFFENFSNSIEPKTLVDLGNMGFFVIGTFVTMLQAFIIVEKAKTNPAKWKTDKILFQRFVAWLETSAMQELQKEYKNINTALRERNTLTYHLFDLRGIRVEMMKSSVLSQFVRFIFKTKKPDWNRTERPSWYMNDSFRKMICDYLNVDRIPTRQHFYQDQYVLVYSNPNRSKFVICFLFTPYNKCNFLSACRNNMVGMVMKF